MCEVQGMKSDTEFINCYFTEKSFYINIMFK